MWGQRWITTTEITEITETKQLGSLRSCFLGFRGRRIDKKTGDSVCSATSVVDLEKCQVSPGLGGEWPVRCVSCFRAFVATG
jgi:hypothetical protein